MITELLICLGFLLVGACLTILNQRIKSIEEHWLKDLEARIKDMED